MQNSSVLSDPSRTGNDFDAFFREQRPGLLRYLTLRLGNGQEAEEVLQEAFIQFLKASETLEIENRHALLVRICSTQAIDRIRSNISRVRRENEWSDGYYRSRSAEGEFGGVTALQDRTVLARDDIRNVLKALDELSETVRQAFILHRFDGLTHGEVAEQMELSRSTVEKHIIKASRHLLQRVERH